MIVELDRKDIISLLKGVCPNYDIMNKIPNDLGHYNGGFRDEWNWSYKIPDKYTDEELYKFYLMCKR